MFDRAFTARAASTFGCGVLILPNLEAVLDISPFLVVSFVGRLLLAATSSLPPHRRLCLFVGAGQGDTNGPLMGLLADLGGHGPVGTLPLVETVGFVSIYAACAVVPLVAGATSAGRSPRRPEASGRVPASRRRTGYSGRQYELTTLLV